MQRVSKPKNARSKRALEKREPKLEENQKKAVFARGSTSSANVNLALSQMLQLKKPDAISFQKSNAGIRPFEDATPLEFFSQKNDAAFVLLGSHSKKRPHNITISRMFDHQLLDMIEIGVDAVTPMNEFKAPKPAIGQKPMFHFAGDLFESHPAYMLLKSLLVDLFHGEVTDSIDLQGLEHVISVSVAPSPSSSSSTIADTVASSETTPPKSIVHFRSYHVKMLRSDSRIPYVALEPCGPSFDFSIRRTSEPASERWKQATTFKRKASYADLTPEQRAAKRRKKMAEKNKDIDAMGDKVGRIHVGKQDLSKLQSRKMKGLAANKKPRKEAPILPEAGDGITEV